MTSLNRRDLFRTTAGLAVFMGLPPALRPALAQEAPGTPFSYEELVARARRMAKEAYVPPYRPMPDVIQQIDYEQHGKLKFKPDRAPYANGGGAYPLNFFHLGQYFGKAVKMHLVESGIAREVPYNPSLFEMPEDSPARKLPPDSGFAGFRLQEWNGASDWRTQDWVAFLGASYFRAIGALGQYGLSARGVAIDAAVPNKAEEFPDFTEFYIAEQADPETPVIVCALLNGPSITGAFRFALKRGRDRSKGVVMDIESALYLRRDVERLGLIPLTSMFWYGEYGRERIRDWRPEVHDSDGLAMWTGSGERIWRPLNNPPSATVSAFEDNNPRGFGLLQRDRNFDHYQDGVMYDRRPSLWVEPLKPLGKGSIELLEIPTDDEIHDNIGAFWVPAGKAKAGNEYTLNYRLHWLADEPYPAENIATTTATRIGNGGEPGKPRPPNNYRFAVEFNRPSVMTKIPYGVFPEVKVTASTGRVIRTFAEPVPNGNIWRAVFDLEVEPREIAELRMYLELNGEPLTETWLYQFDHRNISTFG
ncbi:Glucans biosynthesis protein D 2 [Candidatus Filomicrobium marinum]|uniref:Glucans biosynthesis protein D 2 n=1 Tax=Candidatus Filomicrobium marinum TaxID=1608628 RepID=A0A0D6JCG0_9HYPH|nr:glucan biosynthesis protein [Candidatus Filomicrobium marinum]CFX08826.1 Glucans biosynthesis protein D 2 [Candidatus Filomicrobium marinum]CPR16857.1 Glucans biosynthesis protein D 2 [Candidatus Filomicrobium marinum]